MEKKEMFEDAQSEKRRKDFRQTLIKDSLRSFDAYLEFLNGAHNIFFETPSPGQNSFRKDFKL